MKLKSLELANRGEKREQERIWSIINKKFKDVICLECGIEFTTDEDRRICMGCLSK